MWNLFDTKRIQIFILITFFISSNPLLRAQDKPILIGESMNLQKDYPVVPILYGTSTEGLRSSSDCWSSLGAGYIHINDKFKGKNTSVPTIALDDGSYGPISLGWDFTFYGQTYNSLYVNVNGNITFGEPYSAYSPSGFPSNKVPSMIAPFWADVDLRGTGSGVNNVYIKLEPGKVIVQWVQVGYYKENTDPRNTFQIVLTDANDPDLGIGYNTRFAYGDMNWGVGNASGGTSGFGKTTYATVGAQSAEGSEFYQIGLFGQNNDNYDGPGGSIDGVHYLDGRCFTMDLRTLNVPPVANNLPESREINLTAGMNYDLSTSYASPEIDQITTVDVSNNTLSNFTWESTPGNLSTQNISFTTDESDVGSHYIYIHAQDDGIPNAHTYDTILVNVISELKAGKGSALAFDGVNDHVTVPHNSKMYSSGTGTFSVWIKPSTLSGNLIEPIIQKSSQYAISYDRGSQKTIFTAWKDGTPISLTSNSTITEDEWNHICFSYDGSNLTCYINGIKDSEIEFEGFPSNSISPLYIGTSNQKENFFSGHLDELAYIGTSFSENDIQKLMFELENVKVNYRKFYFKFSNSPVLIDDGPYENNGVLNDFDTTSCWKRNYASIWTGEFSTDWNAAGNWESGLVPVVSDNGSILKENFVIIPEVAAGNKPISITSSVEVNNLIIHDKSSFKLESSGNISIKKNLHGNSNAQFFGNIKFDGFEPQKIFGDNLFYNITIENKVTLQGNQDIKEDLILNSDVLFVNGKTLTLLSDTSGTAEIYHISGSVNGKVVAQRTIEYKANSVGWHYLTSPVTGASFAQINESIPLRGIGNGPNDTPWPNIYLYDETVPSQNKMIGWWSPDSLNQIIEQSQGFILFYNKAEPKTISFIGEVHTGEKNRKITFTNSNKLSSDGWNLVGNPYPSMLDWDLVSFSSTMDKALYVYDNKLDRYSSYVNGIGVNGGTSEIASTQSFFVKSSSETTFSLNNGNRITGKNKWRAKSESPAEHLKISLNTSTDKDEIILVKNENSNNSFDPKEDAYKLSSDNGSFEIYFKMNDIKFSIKNMPFQDETIIPIFISASMGEYSLTIKESSFFNSEINILIQDLLTNEINEFPINENIIFETENVIDKHRFNLIFKTLKSNNLESELVKEKPFYSYSYNQLKINNLPPNCDIQFFDITGKVVLTMSNINSQGSITIPWDYPKGMYLMKILNGNRESSLKVAIYK